MNIVRGAGTRTHTHTSMNRKGVFASIKCVWVCVGVDRTYNDQQNEVDEVVEGMCVHHVVHNLHPALQGDHLESEEGG